MARRAAGALDDELRFAHALADEAARIALPLFRSGPEVQLKADQTPVTEADVEIEAMVRRRVAEHFPGDAVVGEEEGGAIGTGRVWIVDPIDGTKNFAAGIQVWGTLIALARDGEILLGLVSAPALEERYEAVRGGGARLNGAAIRVSAVETIQRATICAYAIEEWAGGPQERALLELVGAGYRSVGFTDFWGHCLVARGSVDVMAEPSLRIWDWAALKVIVEEAGGRMTTFGGDAVDDGTSVLTTNGLVHDQVVARLS